MSAERGPETVWSWIFWIVLAELVVIFTVVPLVGPAWLAELERTEQGIWLTEIGYEATLWAERNGWETIGAP